MTEPARQLSARQVPLWSLLITAAGSMVLVQSVRPLDDPDVWWHVRVGDEILRTHRLPTHESWVWTAAGRRWVPTSWLSDVLLASAHRVAGWQGVRVLTAIVATVFAVALARLLRGRTGAVASAAAYCLAAAVSAGYLRERPQAASLCLVVVLAAWCERARRGDPPPWYLVSAVVWLWACLHGMWVLAPGALLLAGASGGRHSLRRCLPAVVTALAASAITPAGPRLTIQPFVVAHRAQDIAEWAPVQLLSWQALLLAAIALVLSAGRRDERVFAAGILAFGCLAVRDVAPAILLLSPLLATRFEALLPTSSSRVPAGAPRTLAGGAVVVAISVGALTPSVAASVPQQLIAVLDEQHGSHVLVDYDVGGLVTGQARNVSAAVDGRTDIYDPNWLHAYLQATLLRGDWQAVVRRLHPDRAVLRREAALAQALVARGWQVDLTEGQWSLLSAPSGSEPGG